jgi:hypothetical protein
MVHKAYVFDFEPFEQELMPLLEQAVAGGGVEPLLPFLDQHRSELQWTRTIPLPQDLHAWCRQAGPQEVGGLALTAYYDVKENIGIGADWWSAQDTLARLGEDPDILCGWVLQKSGALFDPGGLGSYFQDVFDALTNRDGLNNFLKDHPDRAPLFERARRMFQRALRTGKGKGLYVWF